MLGFLKKLFGGDSAPQQQKSLYERIGGDAAVNAAVDVFYRKVLADKRINKFFEGVDMNKQAAKQKAFLTMAFGGPNNYTGEDMRLGHAHLVEKGLNSSHFDAVMENLGATLKELGVPGDLIGEAAAIAESVRGPVLAGYTKEEKAAMASKKSLYERIGGDAAVNAAVDVFYRKVLADKRINKFFEGVDMGKQAAKQKAFLTMAFGGPNNYTGEDMRLGHAHLVEKGLNSSHFDAVMENLGATLTELGVPGDLIGEAAAIAESVRGPVLAGYTAEEKAAMTSGKKSLYERIGGDAAVNAAVDVFYRKVLADKRINKFFEGVDMGKQAAKQKAFLTMAFGGPNNYTGEDMRLGHAHLVEKGLNSSHFDAVMENLGATLTELGVPGDLIGEAAAIAESVRGPVLAGYTAEEKAAMASGKKSLYERIGGEAAVNAAVDVFYRKVLADNRINKFFEGVDMEKQRGKQKAFLTMALGGPHNYSGKDMRAGHAHLVAKGLNDSHFDAVMENLGATLTELGVPGDLIAEAAAIAESTRNDVLGR